MEELSRSLGGSNGGFSVLMTNSQGNRAASSKMPLLKKLFWVYFLLLIFEGSLRKWILPQLSAPLLLVRDPIALLIVWEAYRTRKWPKQWSGVIGILAASMLGLTFVQLVAGENQWFIALYGLRSYLLPFPVAFIIGENLDSKDLRNFGLCTLWLLIPLVALEVAQYNAPLGSVLNKGAYQGLEQISYFGEHVRASGFFSFVTGPATYVPLAAAFIFYGIVNNSFANKWLLWAASCALILAVPVTGSRGMLVMLMAILGFVAMAALAGVSQLGNALKVGVALVVVALLVSQLPIFSEAADTLQERLSSASNSEGGTAGSLDSRLGVPVMQTIEYSLSSSEWYGNGIGLGSNVASTLLTGTQQFLAGEGESSRILFEFGLLSGSAFMIFRIFLAFLVSARAFAKVRDHQPLAWFLVPVMFTELAFATLEQPTTQGFMVITLGFSLAALKRSDRSLDFVPAGGRA
jgi:hypothetical protein